MHSGKVKGTLCSQEAGEGDERQRTSTAGQGQAEAVLVSVRNVFLT